MNKTNILTASLSFAALVLSVIALSQAGGSTVVERPIGAQAGPEYTETQFFYGGSVNAFALATTTSSSTPFSSNNTGRGLNGATRIDVTPATYQPTFTLPAEVDLSGFLPRAGMTQETLFCNATTTVLKDGQFTFAVGAGVNLINATTSLIVFGKECASLTFSRDASGGLDVFYDKGN